MSLFGLLGSVTRAAVGVVSLPVRAVVDTVDVASDYSNTQRAAKQLGRELTVAEKELVDLLVGK